MKQFFLFTLLIVVVLACNNSDVAKTEVKEGDTTTVEFENTVFDFGTVIQGEKVSYTFKFKNTGDKPLVVSDVTTSCGCTVASYSKEPLSPGSEGYIKITFDTSGRKNNQHKIITVTSNTKPNKTELSIKGVVNQM